MVLAYGRVLTEVVVAKMLPTVNWVPVAERTPDPLEVMMELIGKPVPVIKPESLLNQESLIEEDAMVFT